MSFFNGNSVPLTKVMNNSRGQIQVIFGPMFSGKTTELIRRLNRYTFAQYRCLIIRYFKDDRYSKECIATHDGQTLSATSCSNLYDVINTIDRFDVIGIDEGQFFQDTIISFAEEMANKGKIVIVAALDATFQRTEFGKILQLVPLAESVVKLNAVCMSCFHDASFTKRITNEKEVSLTGGVRGQLYSDCSSNRLADKKCLPSYVGDSTGIDVFQVELIGGTDKYMSVCRECHRLSKPVKNSPCKVFPENSCMDTFQAPKFNI